MLPVTEALNSCSPEVMSAGTLRYRSVSTGTALTSTLAPCALTSSYLSSLVSLKVLWVDVKRIGPTLPSEPFSLRVKEMLLLPWASTVGCGVSFRPVLFCPVRYVYSCWTRAVAAWSASFRPDHW